MNPGPLRLSILVLVAAASAAFWATQPAQGTSEKVGKNSDHVRFHQEPWPYEDTTLIAPEMRDPLNSLTELIEENDGDFAGIRLAKNELIIAATTERGESLASEVAAQDELVRVARGHLSVEHANQVAVALFEADPILKDNVYKWAVNPSGESLRIGMFAEPPPEVRQKFESFASNAGVVLDLYIDDQMGRPKLGDSRREDDSPYAGGPQLSKGQEQDRMSDHKRSVLGRIRL